ncbi:hypothetical protein OAG71_00650 [bacterium]|nr:hypothetical protein [bacterium]
MMPAYVNYKPSVDWSRVSTTPPERVLCPSCGCNGLGLNSSGIDYSVTYDDDVVPATGQLVHADLKKSKRPEIPYWLFVTRLNGEYTTSYKITNDRDKNLKDGHHEFRVEKVSNAAPRNTLRHIRELTPEEWKWYYSGRDA